MHTFLPVAATALVYLALAQALVDHIVQILNNESIEIIIIPLWGKMTVLAAQPNIGTFM